VEKAIVGCFTRSTELAPNSRRLVHIHDISIFTVMETRKGWRIQHGLIW
jgi:hypothetical protein